jgi:hypothetical protein
LDAKGGHDWKRFDSLAKGAISKLDRTPDEQSIPAPREKVREVAKKDE